MIKVDLFDRRKDDVVCPYCEHIQDNETMYSCVTYWGDDGDHKKVSCESCNKDFFVAESVKREWSTYKEEEEPK